VSRGIIFQELFATSGDIIQLILYVHVFYAFESLMFYSHYNREGNVTIIPSTMGTHQGDSLGGPLFVLTRLKTLHSITNHFLSCLFPSITYDIHITGPPQLYHLHMSI